MNQRQIIQADLIRQAAGLLAKGLPIPGDMAQSLIGHALKLQVGRVAFSVYVTEVRGLEVAELLVVPVAGAGSTWYSTNGNGLVQPRFQGPIVPVRGIPGEKD